MTNKRKLIAISVVAIAISGVYLTHHFMTGESGANDATRAGLVNPDTGTVRRTERTPELAQPIKALPSEGVGSYKPPDTAKPTSDKTPSKQ